MPSAQHTVVPCIICEGTKPSACVNRLTCAPSLGESQLTLAALGVTHCKCANLPQCSHR